MTLRQRIIPWLFLIPALVIAIAFHIAPFVDTIIKSFTDFRPSKGGQFIGFDNYISAFDSPKFWSAMTNTLTYVVVSVPFLVILPLLLAVLAFPKIPGMGFFRAAYYTPVVASMVAVGIVWQMLLREDGIINWMYTSLLPGAHAINFLSDPDLFLFCAMVVTIWKGLGYYMVIYLAALAQVPPELLEAAAVDGAGATRRFWHVTLPSVRPTMLLIGLLGAIACMKVFAEVYVLGGGSTAGPANSGITMVFLIRQNMSGFDSQVGYASALSIILFLLTIGLSVAFLRIGQTQENS